MYNGVFTLDLPTDMVTISFKDDTGLKVDVRLLDEVGTYTNKIVYDIQP